VTDPDKKTRMGTPAPAGPYTGGLVAQTSPPPEPNAQDPAAGSQSWGDTTQGGDFKPITHSAAPVYVPPVDPLLGQVLAGRYLIERKLGEGGMGAVYLSKHTILEKAVALKILHGEFARKPDLVERFMQEARAASRIRHENVIDISDFGSTPDGLVFFAMELLHGHDLHEEIARARLAKTRLPWDRSRKIFLQICSALAAAHSHGIVHRDLKPENIYLVDWLGHKDFVKLLDFGIAKLTEGADGDRKLTRTGMLFGTPEYMSPEQARGENVDHRVDIYAMGCILFQLCTGKVPFEAENFMGILSLHLTEPPPPIGPEILAEIGAPPEIELIIHKALAKGRAERWDTIDEMANAIRALHGEDAQPVLESTVPRAKSAAPRTTQAAAAPAARTQWKGSVSIPTEDDAPSAPAPKSKLPLILAAVVAVAIVAVIVVVVAGGSKAEPAAPPGPTPIGSSVSPPGTPPPVTDSAVPARVTISIDTVPQGAEIYDMTRKEVVGNTPFDFELPGSHDARRYTLKLAGYGGKMIELLPVEDVKYVGELKKVEGASAGGAVPEVVEVVPQKARPGRKTPVAEDRVPVVDNRGGSDGPSTSPDGPATAPGGGGSSKPTGSGKKPGGTGATPTNPDKGSGTPVVKPPVDPDPPGDPDIIPLKPMGAAATP